MNYIVPDIKAAMMSPPSEGYVCFVTTARVGEGCLNLRRCESEHLHTMQNIHRKNPIADIGSVCF